MQFKKVGRGLLREAKRREGEWAVLAKAKGDIKIYNQNNILMMFKKVLFNDFELMLLSSLNWIPMIRFDIILNNSTKIFFYLFQIIQSNYSPKFHIP